MSRTMITMNTLKYKAIRACNWRGHNMGKWKDHSYRNGVAYCHCLDCDMQVAVILNPLPNEINIGGEAVALTCGSESRFN